MQAGEYVSLGKVESALKSSAVIDEICVYAESSKDFVIAFIVPNPKQLQEIATNEGLSKIKFDDLYESPVVIKAILKEINEQARKGSFNERYLCIQFLIIVFFLFFAIGNLQKFEVPAAIKLCKEAWTPESGLVTAAFKLKRKEIQNFYQNDIDKMYAHKN